MKQTLLITALTALFGGVAMADTNLHFGFDSSELPPMAGSTLCSTVKAAKGKACCSKKIVLDGHTDDVGASDYNVGLSLRRAEAVKAKLVDMGISADRIVISSFGEVDATGGKNQEDRKVGVKFTGDSISSIVDDTFEAKGTSVTWGTPTRTAEIETAEVETAEVETAEVETAEMETAELETEELETEEIETDDEG